MSQIISQDKNIVKFNLEISVQDFDNALQEAYLRNRSKFNIQGFRKGKATRAMIEKMYGEGVFYDEAIDIVFPEAYKNAVADLNLKVIDRPSLDLEDIGKGKELKLVITVQVSPEVKLGDYKEIEITKVDSEVTEEDIQHEIGHLLDENARLAVIEDRPVKEGDIILLDFLGKVDDIPFEGGEAKNFELTIGSGSFIPGFEEQLVGLQIGEESDINVTFPEEYHSEDLKGKDAVFTVKVNEIKEKQLPDFDDEFVSETSEFDTAEEFKADLKNKIAENKKNYALNTMKNEAVAKLAEIAEVEVPEVMVKNETENMIKDFEQNLRYQGMDLNSYFNYTGTTKEQLADQMKVDATNRVKMTLALEELAKLENIVATEDDLDIEYKKMADMYKLDIEQIKNIFKNSDLGIENSIVANKAADFLLENCKHI